MIIVQSMIVVTNIGYLHEGAYVVSAVEKGFPP